MKKLIYLIVAIVTLSLIIAGCGIPVVPPAEQDELSTPTSRAILTVGPSGTYATIQAAITAASSGDTITVAAGTYYEVGQIVINKNLTIIGADKVTTIIKPDHDTTIGYYLITNGWFYIDPVASFELRNVTLDGTGRTIHTALQSRGELIVEDCIIKNIYARQDLGIGVQFLAGLNNSVVRCEFSDIQRIGIHVRGSIESTNPVAHIEDCTYVGKGNGDWLDYGIEFGGGGSGTVDGCNISACTGLISIWTSAGILATGKYGVGTSATIKNSTFTGNTEGIHAGYNETDTIVLTAHYNNIFGNIEYGIFNVGTEEVDATCNWWGDFSGPTHSGNPDGTGDAVSDNVDFNPWLLGPAPDAVCYDYYEDGFEEIVACAVNAKNHGKFVSCVGQLTNSWLEQELISAEEKGAIMSWAAKSDIGKK
ncbi:MAG: right-handed parallel beta-helix repeat-containing protein [Candidatus Marinimicrobia bacterium]|nr:right-handed parallel beta-helix repeat-containing protein [Actinomycetota bacterium]MCG2715072.1 right-handed parallel beta-helix repeat-containing protein [Candidatus Neomarinimicrobiota bacterium]